MFLNGGDHTDTDHVENANKSQEKSHPLSSNVYTILSNLCSKNRTVDELGLSDLEVFTYRLFSIRERETTVWQEIKCGVLHFVSCAFILAVNPSLLEPAGYSTLSVASGTALVTGLSCIFCGILSNLPFVLAPTTSTSIYFSIFLQNRAMSPKLGQVSVFLLGILFSLCGFKRVAIFVSNIVPFCIKVGVCLGVGLLIALEALTEIGLVKNGIHTVLDIGEFNIEIYVAMFTFAVIGISLHHKIRGSFLVGLVFGTILYWIASVMELTTDPDKYRYTNPTIKDGDMKVSFRGLLSKNLYTNDDRVYRLVFDLFVIGIILLSGLSHGLAETSGLKRPSGTLPRGKWLYLACGFGTMLAAGLGCGPVMISPESAPAIKAGARTGLSTVVCGLLFLLSTIFCPLFAMAPAASTSPVLLMIGMMLFENARHVNWSLIKEALPVFLMATFIPFTYSILNGVIFGFGMYCILFIFTENELFSKKLRIFIKRSKALWYSTCGGGRNASNGNNSSVSSSSSDVHSASEQLYVSLSASDYELNDPSDSMPMDVLGGDQKANSKKFSFPSLFARMNRYASDSSNDSRNKNVDRRAVCHDSDSDVDNDALFDLPIESSHFLSFQMNEINDGASFSDTFRKADKQLSSGSSTTDSTILNASNLVSDN